MTYFSQLNRIRRLENIFITDMKLFIVEINWKAKGVTIDLSGLEWSENYSFFTKIIIMEL